MKHLETERLTTELLAFGKRMRVLRKERKLTLVDLEVAIGIDNGDLSKIENGLTNIEFNTIVKIATGFDIEIYELFAPAK
ncbi:helix-turn-helix domain-containing protein [Deminuibacter soli]|uniref:XRE family transcriptional regulator n=1 Tax=Deminuibacter soli TaxID=2291815 RepID=A0A3E1NMG8_9BACT|nr:helix-turn-helix transcriptional regulator [Deminuibacter soli]RFM29113.1 XRE family transcriptional regulator [Deminuibacter soli]